MRYGFKECVQGLQCILENREGLKALTGRGRGGGGEGGGDTVRGGVSALRQRGGG